MGAKKEKSNDLNRRQFLKQTAGIAVVAGLFSPYLLPEALAAARKSGKPLLTPQDFERSIPQPGTPEFHQHIAAAKQNLRAYFEQNFYLTQQQRDAIDGLSAADREKLNQALDTAEKRKLKIRVQHHHSPGNFSVQPQVTGDSLVVRSTGRADCPNKGGGKGLQ